MPQGILRAGYASHSSGTLGEKKHYKHIENLLFFAVTARRELLDFSRDTTSSTLSPETISPESPRPYPFFHVSLLVGPCPLSTSRGSNTRRVLWQLHVPQRVLPRTPIHLMGLQPKAGKHRNTSSANQSTARSKRSQVHSIPPRQTYYPNTYSSSSPSKLDSILERVLGTCS